MRELLRRVRVAGQVLLTGKAQADRQIVMQECTISFGQQITPDDAARIYDAIDAEARRRQRMRGGAGAVRGLA